MVSNPEAEPTAAEPCQEPTPLLLDGDRKMNLGGHLEGCCVIDVDLLVGGTAWEFRIPNTALPTTTVLDLKEQICTELGLGSGTASTLIVKGTAELVDNTATLAATLASVKQHVELLLLESSALPLWLVSPAVVSSGAGIKRPLPALDCGGSVVQASTAPAEGRTKTGAAAASEAERAVPSSAKAPHKYVVGDKVLVLDQFISKKTKTQKTKWRKASVLQAEGGKVEIHFDGWSEKWNFWLDLNVPEDRKRLALCATSSDTTFIVGGSSLLGPWF